MEGKSAYLKRGGLTAGEIYRVTTNCEKSAETIVPRNREGSNNSKCRIEMYVPNICPTECETEVMPCFPSKSLSPGNNLSVSSWIAIITSDNDIDSCNNANKIVVIINTVISHLNT